MNAETGSPEAAERAFYAAFEDADLEAMRTLWSRSPEVVCVHPGGPRLTGFEAVMESWRQIFDSGQRLRFRLRGRRQLTGSDLVLHCLIEEIETVGEAGPAGRVLVTNGYRREEGGWRMVLHHASAPPRSDRPEGPVH